MQIKIILKKFGFSEKEADVYLALVALGASSASNIAKHSKVNRGTIYNILKSLISLGVVSYYNKESKQYFIAEEPEKLLLVAEQKKQDLEEVAQTIHENLPVIKSLYKKDWSLPVVKFYESKTEVKQIFEDVLQSVANLPQKAYQLYSLASVDSRKTVYEGMQDFSQRRVGLGISVRIISLGETGVLAGLDERKQMVFQNFKKLGKSGATHEIIYANKVAHISVDRNQNPVGVVIQNEAIYNMQKMIFEFNWKKL